MLHSRLPASQCKSLVTGGKHCLLSFGSKCCDCFVNRGENKPGGWIFKPVPDNPDRCIFGWIFNTDLKVSSKLLNFACDTVELTCYKTAHHTDVCIVALLMSD